MNTNECFTLQIGDTFEAVLRKSRFSVTLGGKQVCGRRVGPFIVTEANAMYYTTDERMFYRKWWNFQKVEPVKERGRDESVNSLRI